MSPTPSVAVVMNGDRIESLAADLRTQWLQPREVFLKGRAPRDRKLHQRRRDIACAKARPFEMLIAGSIADLRDGAPLSAVAAPYLALAAVLAEIDAQLHADRVALIGDPRGFLRLVQTENRLQAERDAAERELLADPSSAEAHDRALLASAAYEEANDRLIAAVRAGRARLTAGATVIELVQ